MRRNENPSSHIIAASPWNQSSQSDYRAFISKGEDSNNTTFHIKTLQAV